MCNWTNIHTLLHICWMCCATTFTVFFPFFDIALLFLYYYLFVWLTFFCIYFSSFFSLYILCVCVFLLSVWYYFCFFSLVVFLLSFRIHFHMKWVCPSVCLNHLRFDRCDCAVARTKEITYTCGMFSFLFLSPALFHSVPLHGCFHCCFASGQCICLWFDSQKKKKKFNIYTHLCTKRKSIGYFVKP